MYAYVAFLVVVLTYGMETAFFRFSTIDKKNRLNIYSNTLYSLFCTSALFIATASIFAENIADWLKYPNHKEYIIWFSLIVSLDAISSIPLAKLRLEEKAKKFALVNILNVAVNIFLNLFFIIYCKEAYENGEQNWFLRNLYDPEIGIGYVFISNLIASILKFSVLVPVMNFKGHFDFTILKQMIKYASPMLLVGLAYVINETLDRALAKVMNYFVIVLVLTFLVMTLFLHLFNYFIPNPVYWSGLKVVPILLAANICLGIYTSLSIWYKLSQKTIYGAIISIIGVLITLLVNFIFIPKYGYEASAYATLFCYGSMVIISYFTGQFHYKVPYNLKKIFIYFLAGGLIYAVSLDFNANLNYSFNEYCFHIILVFTYLGLVYFLERPKKNNILKKV